MIVNVNKRPGLWNIITDAQTENGGNTLTLTLTHKQLNYETMISHWLFTIDMELMILYSCFDKTQTKPAGQMWRTRCASTRGAWFFFQRFSLSHFSCSPRFSIHFMHTVMQQHTHTHFVKWSACETKAVCDLLMIVKMNEHDFTLIIIIWCYHFVFIYK